MKIHSIQILVTIFIITPGPVMALSDENSSVNTALHFDQPQTALKSLNFKHNDELKPVSSNFRIVEVFYLSNNIGERWATVTFENRSSGQRLLENKTIVATFADGAQAYSLNLNEVFKGNEYLSKAVFFGVSQFPIVSVQVE